MVNLTYISKSNTIVKNSRYNLGLQPTSILKHGVGELSRTLLYFDVNELVNRYNDKTYGDDIKKLHHTLIMENCGSFDNENMERASSFDIILFKLPQEWDEGIGFNNKNDYYVNSKQVLSCDGSNWYKPMNGMEWPEEGVYSNTTLALEYDKFSRGENSIVIGRQHFDYGNERFEIDITNYVNELILKNSKNNYGIGVAFSPMTEEKNEESVKYISYFNNKTNTFFKPYVRTICDVDICDDRASFYLNKNNKLYLYSYINNELTNLDELPICTINNNTYEVKQASKGVYYIELMLPPNDVYSPDTIMYDTWTNLVYNKVALEDVEMEFVLQKPNIYFNIGNKPSDVLSVKPYLSGINDNEDILKGDIRNIHLNFRKKYTTSEYNVIDNCEYRLYVKEGNREIDVIPFTPINKMFLENTFFINTNDLLPSTYYIDVKYYVNNGVYTEKNILKFNVINNITIIKK